ncbi:MAG: glycoside hydrolase family 2 protein [Lentimicrobium sp.]|nr:glycoside hydrolase family 2 protein [Lentimicrobium sp.]
MKLRWIILVFVVMIQQISVGQSSAALQYELDKNWEFRQAGTANWMPATVPGTVHTDMMANGKMEDPYYRMNEREVQWIDKVNWEYKSSFSVEATLLKRQNITLVFEGLDTYARVYLNGSLLLETNNMFRTWKVPVKSLLSQGENELRLEFLSPVIKGLSLMEIWGYPLPGDNDQSERGGMGPNKVSPFVRKAPYHFGWDWGPRLVTSGIWKPVYLEAFDAATIDEIYVTTLSLSDKKATMQASMVTNKPLPSGQALTLTVNGEKTGIEKVITQENLTTVNFSIPNPKRWWPNGLGEQPLYKIGVQWANDGELLDDTVVNIGLRTLKLIREPDKSGESFYFEVNGRPVFAKGANYIPNDLFLPRVSPEKYEYIVRSAAEANLNMLRVWGGGIYENDIFYDLCDKYGIMVWQDFMFACSMYPGNADFLNNVRLEAEQNVQRLRNHACLALWCGNNEMEYAWAQGHEERGWGWKQLYNTAQRAQIWQAYDTIFHHILPKVVTDYAPGQPYWHSSPSAGMGKLAKDDNTSGDMHYWGVWHGQEPFSAFRKYKARFMSEYGFQSFPEYNSVKRYTLPEDRDIESEVMAWHQRSGIGNLRIREYMEAEYKVPADIEEFLYVGQVLQAEAIGDAMRIHRAAMPYCMGSLYWQLNDCWPVASWSGIDYYGRWKAMHYKVKEACKNQIIYAVIEDNELKVYGINDLPEKVPAILRLNLARFDGESLWNRPVNVVLPANSAALIYSMSFSKLPVKYAESELFLTVLLTKGLTTLDREILFFTSPKMLKLPDPEIKTRVSDKGDHLVIEISSDKFCKSLMLSSEDDEARFSDNFFDLLPGEVRRITCTTTQRWEDFERGLKLLHLKQTM